MLKKLAFCIKLRCNLCQVIACSDASNDVFCVKLQRIMHGIAWQKDKNERIKAIKRLRIGAKS